MIGTIHFKLGSKMKEFFHLTSISRSGGAPAWPRGPPLHDEQEQDQALSRCLSVQYEYKKTTKYFKFRLSGFVSNVNYIMWERSPSCYSSNTGRLRSTPPSLPQSMPFNISSLYPNTTITFSPFPGISSNYSFPWPVSTLYNPDTPYKIVNTAQREKWVLIDDSVGLLNHQECLD